VFEQKLEQSGSKKESLPVIGVNRWLSWLQAWSRFNGLIGVIRDILGCLKLTKEDVSGFVYDILDSSSDDDYDDESLQLIDWKLFFDDNLEMNKTLTISAEDEAIFHNINISLIITLTIWMKSVQVERFSALELTQLWRQCGRTFITVLHHSPSWIPQLQTKFHKTAITDIQSIYSNLSRALDAKSDQFNDRSWY